VINFNFPKKGFTMHLSIAVLSLTLLSGTAIGAVVAVGPGAFPASPVLNFSTLATGTEVNGLVVNGVQFTYSLGNGIVIIDGGPGVTNNITPQNIVSIGNNTGVLGVLLPSQSTLFGYGYAILNTITVANATTIALFLGASPVGSLSYMGVPDPTFAGGFAGIQSTLPFDRVQLTFNSAVAPAFAVDNVRFAAIPEPSTYWLMLGPLVFGVRRRTRVTF
jgi:hypothetical protein